MPYYALVVKSQHVRKPAESHGPFTMEELITFLNRTTLKRGQRMTVVEVRDDQLTVQLDPRRWGICANCSTKFYQGRSDRLYCKESCRVMIFRDRKKLRTRGISTAQIDDAGAMEFLKAWQATEEE